MLPLLENIKMQFVDIDDSLEPPCLYPKIDIRKSKSDPSKERSLNPKFHSI
jgi:hypothetical protein